MSMKNTIKINDYIPPAPKTLKITENDNVKDYQMMSGDITRYTIREAVKTVDVTFEVTREQANAIKTAIRSATEINITYADTNGETTIIAMLKSFNIQVTSITRKGIYTVTASFQESRRE